jgi:phospholipid/cholesterol/gamma-HCH transport system substrate-binding protein
MKSALSVSGQLTKLIIFIAITAVLTAALAVTIASTSFGGKITYRAQFTDVAGLNESDDVRVAGVRVGSVSSIKVVGAKLAEVAFTVDNTVHLSIGTNARIRYRNLVGTRYLALTDGPGPVGELRPDALIPTARTQPALDLTVLLNGFKPLFTALNPKDVNNLAYEIIQVLQGEGGTVDSLLASTSSLTNTLANRDALIGQVINNLNQVLATVVSRDTQLSNLIVQLQRFVSGLATDRTAIGDSLANIASLSSATAGLLTDARPSIKSDIASLNQVATTLNGSSDVVNGVLQRLPTKLSKLTALGYGGGWFNFYLCSMGGYTTLPAVGKVPVGPIDRAGYPCNGGSQ